MTQPPRPNPAQVPTLTEVIDLMSPAPVRDDGMNSAPRGEPPAPGTVDGAPIVTGGLADRSLRPAWAPMSTVVVPSLEAVPDMASLPLSSLPVLEAVVPERALMAPVLTEAVPPELVRPAAADTAPPPMPEAPRLAQEVAQEAAPVAIEVTEVSEAQLAQRVMSDVQRQIDGMLDYRLREAMVPILAAHTDALVRDLREELNRTMRDVVARSVAQEMAKLRQR